MVLPNVSDRCVFLSHPFAIDTKRRIKNIDGRDAKLGSISRNNCEEYKSPLPNLRICYRPDNVIDFSLCSCCLRFPHIACDHGFSL